MQRTVYNIITIITPRTQMNAAVGLSADMQKTICPISTMMTFSLRTQMHDCIE